MILIKQDTQISKLDKINLDSCTNSKSEQYFLKELSNLYKYQLKIF